MRDRHLPRLCRACQAPMARQKDVCWRCAAPWTSTPQLRLVPSDDDQLTLERDTDRWADEGGMLARTPMPMAPASLT